MTVTQPRAPRLERPAELAAFLRDYLVNDIAAFWTRHAIDPAGGINSCIRDDGTVVSRDKWAWSQWRSVWVFSELYRLIEPREEWLDVAQRTFRFFHRHGWNEQRGGYNLVLDGDGKPLRGPESVYADGFAIYGCVALARALGGAASGGAAREAVAAALRSAEYVLEMLQRPHEQIPHFPYPVPAGAQVHGIPMMFSLVFWELGELLDDDRFRRIGVELSDRVFGTFYRSDRGLLFERVGNDGRELPPPLGTAVVPGHAVEDMWFQMHIALDRGDRRRVERAIPIIKRHVEAGWDQEFGGLYLAIDADGRDEVGWAFADSKLWWPQTEALYALALAYEHSGEAWASEWFDRVWDYAFAHYPVAGHGEWRQKLDRRGQPFTDVVALPVKDPFHLPRVLIYLVRCAERMAKAEAGARK